jgi:hypothetical protein
MAQIARVTTWASGQVLTAAALNGEFNNLVNAWNSIDNAGTSWTAQSITGNLTVGGIVGISSAGTVSAPAIYIGGDTQSGLYQSASGEIRITTSGVLNTIFDKYGNIGLNVANPSATIGTSSGGFILKDGGRAASTTLVGFEDSSGNLLLGLTAGGTFTLQGGATSTFSVSSGGLVTCYGNLKFNATSTQGIVGTTTNDSPAAGNVGQNISSAVTGVSLPSSNAYGDLTSISLTAGDWTLSAQIALSGASTTATFIAIGISTTSGNSNAGLTTGDNYMTQSATSGEFASAGISGYRVSISSTTTYYAKMTATYTGGTQAFNGRITAVRVR